MELQLQWIFRFPTKIMFFLHLQKLRCFCSKLQILLKVGKGKFQNKQHIHFEHIFCSILCTLGLRFKFLRKKIQQATFIISPFHKSMVIPSVQLVPT